VVSVQQWAEIRRMRFVDGLAIREIRRRTELHRETIRRALRSSTPPGYVRMGEVRASFRSNASFQRPSVG
jgi:DNA-binding transcriptional regulator LsrR (DeoR family)